MARKRKLVHKGVWFDRTKAEDGTGPREKAFADTWQKENVPRRHFPFSSSCSRLEMLMRNESRLIPVSEESATAVATIVQWLGSNCGWVFLEASLHNAGYRIVPLNGETKK
jgi:hypothetical protein